MRLGLIAGNGQFPLLFAKEAKREGHEIAAVAIRGETDPALGAFVERLHWIYLGQLKKLIQILKEENVRSAVMAGQIQHRKLFSNIRPDLKAAALLFHLKDHRAESLLAAVAGILGKEGIRLKSSLTFLSRHLATKGPMTRKAIPKGIHQDILFGARRARALAREDVGQTLVVKSRAVVAVEAMEGTDACIRRGASIAGEGVVVVKAARPRQDLRWDVPVVGPGTLTVLKETRAKALAIESGKTLMLQRPDLISDCDAFGIHLYGI